VPRLYANAQESGVSIFCGIGERSREREALYACLVMNQSRRVLFLLL
jgi:F0F1-type ATP synthase beta subunit